MKKETWFGYERGFLTLEGKAFIYNQARNIPKNWEILSLSIFTLKRCELFELFIKNIGRKDIDN